MRERIWIDLAAPVVILDYITKGQRSLGSVRYTGSMRPRERKAPREKRGSLRAGDGNRVFSEVLKLKQH